MDTGLSCYNRMSVREFRYAGSIAQKGGNEHPDSTISSSVHSVLSV